ncbi:MAG: alpha/beta fold hydrolase [Chloroflexi bacterium]|nr:alpha/beta fold hydrolase [Chloroflexota bacterium]
MNPNIDRQAAQKSRRSRLKSTVYILFCTILLIFVVVFCVIYLQVIQLTTPGRNQDIGALTGIPHQDITLTTADGLKLSGWYVPGTQANAIVIVHGIHANRAYLLPQAKILAQAGYQLLLFDLRGHGLSEGNMVTYGGREALDVEAAVDYLAALPNVKHIGALGHSLGGAAVVRAAADDPRLQALVIQSSYSSLAQVVDESFNRFAVLPRWPLAPLVIALAEFRTGIDAERINSLHDLAMMPARPVLVIHSADDDLFPPHYAQEMYDAARGPKELWIIDRAGGHVNPITGHEAEYKERLLKFFEGAFSQ